MYYVYEDSKKIKTVNCKKSAIQYVLYLLDTTMATDITVLNADSQIVVQYRQQESEKRGWELIYSNKDMGQYIPSIQETLIAKADKLIDIQEFCSKYKISPSTIYRWDKENKLIGKRKQGYNLYFDEEKTLGWLSLV